MWNLRHWLNCSAPGVLQNLFLHTSVAVTGLSAAHSSPPSDDNKSYKLRPHHQCFNTKLSHLHQQVQADTHHNMQRKFVQDA